jgi:hypothetical protein
MALATYNDLKASVADWLNRADLTAVIPDFIALSEARFNREMRVAQMVKVATATVSDGYFAVPADHLQTISLRVTAPDNYNGKCEFVSIQRLNELNGNPNLTNTSRYYSIVDGNFRLAPQPNGETTLELTYYGKIPTLSDSNTTNWLLTKSPDLYLYASLMQASPYLKDDERVALWATAMGQAMEAMQLEAERAQFPEGKLNATRRTFG